MARFAWAAVMVSGVACIALAVLIGVTVSR